MFAEESLGVAQTAGLVERDRSMRRLAQKLIVPAVVSLCSGAVVCGYAQTPAAKQSAPSASGEKAETQISSASPPAKMDAQQARILADTQRLRKLSEELRAEVDKSSKETLSLSVIKKAQEVEKLAKSLKEEISKSY
jgi:hypothetical protein